MGNTSRGQLDPRVRKGRGGRPYRRLQAQVFREETHCWLCQGYVDQTLPHNHNWARSLDHIIPLTQGGDPLARTNARMAHRVCNIARGNRIHTVTQQRISTRVW
jgi:5-methylcytosine-specific restriction endonuclease McrA